jgi:hypothetical protein
MRVKPLLSAGVLLVVLMTAARTSPAQAAPLRFPRVYRPIVPPRLPVIGSSLPLAANLNNTTPFARKLAASEAMTAQQMTAGRVPPFLHTPPYVMAMMQPYAFAANGYLYYRRPGGTESGVVPLFHFPIPQSVDDPNDPNSGD